MLNKNEISDFPANTTKKFWIGFQINGQVQDIRNDTMTLRFKSNRSDPDGSAVITKSADLSIRGAAGQGYFNLTPAETAIAPGEYYVGVELVRTNGDEYVLIDQKIKVSDRIADI